MTEAENIFDALEAIKEATPTMLALLVELSAPTEDPSPYN